MSNGNKSDRCHRPVQRQSVSGSWIGLGRSPVVFAAAIMLLWLTPHALAQSLITGSTTWGSEVKVPTRGEKSVNLSSLVGDRQIDLGFVTIDGKENKIGMDLQGIRAEIGESEGSLVANMVVMQVGIVQEGNRHYQLIKLGNRWGLEIEIQLDYQPGFAAITTGSVKDYIPPLPWKVILRNTLLGVEKTFSGTLPEYRREGDRGKVGEIDESGSLKDRKSGLAAQGIKRAGFLRELCPALSGNGTKIVVLIHGWNPNGIADPYSTGAWAAIIDAWKTRQKQYPEWQLLAYDWHEDAATGKRYPDPAGSGTKAAEMAYWHGWELGRILVARRPELEKVQFIAHSAGSWAARSAALLVARDTAAAIQVTLLDPYMPQFPASSLLNRGLMDKLDDEGCWRAGQPEHLENYFTKDISLWSTQSEFDWRAARNTQAVVSYNTISAVLPDLDQTASLVIDMALKCQEFRDGHGLPITWYAATMYAPQCYPQGWAISLPHREGQAATVADLGVVAVVDESGSMKGRKIELAKQGVILLKELLSSGGAGAEMGLVGFSDNARRICSLLRGPELDQIDTGVASLGKGGQTAIGLGIHEGLRCIMESSQPNRSLVLLSDGQHNTGELWPYVKEAAQALIPVHVINLEAGPDAAETLQRIAFETGGEYFDGDVENIQQIYASVSAQMSGQCVLLYKTDVIQQNEVRDYKLFVADILKNVGGIAGQITLKVNLSWPGSRLDLRVLDAGGKDVSHAVLSNVKRSPSFMTASMASLFASEYTLRVVGEEVPGAGEPFVLQVLANAPSGLHVKPPRSNYRVGDDILISGSAPAQTDISDITFEVIDPAGKKSTCSAIPRTAAAKGMLWQASFPPPEDVGVYNVIGRVAGKTVYVGSYRCGSVEEVLLQRMSPLALIDRERLRLRRQLPGRNEQDVLKHYAALTFAASLARTVDAMEPLWSELIRSWDGKPEKLQDTLGLLLPFVGKFGIESLSVENAGALAVSTRAGLRERRDPLTPNQPFMEDGGRYWIRLPLAKGTGGKGPAFIVETAPVSDELLCLVLMAFNAPGDFGRWQAVEVRVQVEASMVLLSTIAAVEQAVWKRALTRGAASRSYTALVSTNPGYFVYLTIRDQGGNIMFEGAGGAERDQPAMVAAREDIFIEVPFGGRKVGQVSARVINTGTGLE